VEVRLALDSNRYSDLCRNVREAVETVEQAVQVFMPFVVLAELRAGFSVGQRGVENERTLTRFLNRTGVQVILAEETTTHHYAAVYRQLRRQGTPIPTNDIWIAALVLEHDLALYARDRHFDHLPQLRRL
jgi:tRNA(fMet)-specific endonuclease VapC